MELAFKGIKPSVLYKPARTRYMKIPAMVVRRCDLLGVPFEDDKLFDLYIDVDEKKKTIKLVYERSEK